MSGPCILLVEDEPDDAALIQRAISKLPQGQSLVLRHLWNGDEAVAYLAEAGPSGSARDSLPDLMLIDLKLPRRSGFEVIEWVRGRDGLRRLPIVVLTSSAQQVDIDGAYDAGANAYLVKPSSPRELAAMLETTLSFWLHFAARGAIRPS
ncbi:response regulator [Chelativorans sp.]|uniref:response regulator n=1 Tax=Chelativorans sp. TaxID=2203393 RepID=UPI0028126DC1|nr:response regulator [Chelativorans sp.]